MPQDLRPLRAAFDAGEATALDPDNTPATTTGRATTTLQSPWLHLRCKVCAHTFRAGDAVRARADGAAQDELERTAEVARAELEAQARTHLDAVGLRCRQAFHQVLASGYRDVLLAYARRQGAEVVTHHEDDGAVEIELQWSR